MPWVELAQKLDALRSSKRIVFTNGCFDILHVGHIVYLEQAKALGDLLVVGLNSDQSVQNLKGSQRPIQTQEDRKKILLSLRSVDFVEIFDQPTPEQLIHAVKPHVLVKGGDWPIEKIVGGSFVQSYGGQVKSLAFVPGRSTSSIVEKIIHTT